MRFEVIKTVFIKELVEMLRNRRSLIVMFGVPVLLYPLLTIMVASIAQSKQDEMTHRQAVVLIHGGANAPKLMEMLNAEGSGIRADEDKTSDAQAKLKSGVAEALIEIPEGYQADAIAAKDDELKILLDRSQTAAAFAETKIDKVVHEYELWIVEQRLAEHQLPAALAHPPTYTIQNVATTGQTFGMFLARTLPLLLLLTGMLGALYPALNATTTERELGTLETLLVTPTTRGELLTAKAAMVLLSALLTALLNMVSMSLVLWRTLPQLERIPGGISIDSTALALSFVAAVPTLMFFAALVLMVGLMARNLREANAYATPVMLIPIASMLIGIADPTTTPALLLTPVANTTVIIRDILTGHFRLSEFVLAFASSCVYAGLVLSLAARLFTNEQLVNPAWEPVSLKGLGRRRGPKRIPAVDEAITLFAISLLLVFYISPSWAKHGLLALLMVTELVLIAVPALIFGWVGNYRWREVFSWHRPTAATMTGGLFMGLGLIPIVNLISWLQQYFNILPPRQSDLEGLSKLFEPALQAHPVFLPIILGLLAGVCEETLFRGPIQTAFIRRFPITIALGVGGLLFAAAHMDLSGFIVRWGLGIVLGWVVWRSGSVFPAMLLHATYDGVSVGIAAWQAIHKTGAESYAVPNPLGTMSDQLLFVLGIGLTVSGWLLIRSRVRHIGAIKTTTQPMATATG